MRTFKFRTLQKRSRLKGPHDTPSTSHESTNSEAMSSHVQSCPACRRLLFNGTEYEAEPWRISWGLLGCAVPAQGCSAGQVQCKCRASAAQVQCKCSASGVQVAQERHNESTQHKHDKQQFMQLPWPVVWSTCRSLTPGEAAEAEMTAIC